MDKEGSQRQRGKLDSATDETLDEYLISLQQKNRILKRLKSKDPKEIELERLEQGFSIYLNGANAEASRQPKRPSQRSLTSPPPTSRTTHTADALRRHAAELAEEDLRDLEQARRKRSRTAPGKVQRREWVQSSLSIRAEEGPHLRVSPGKHYSEDFEAYESIEMERSSPRSPHSPRSPRDACKVSHPFSSRCEGRGSQASPEHNERVLLNIDEVKVLRRSLEVNMRRSSRGSAGEESEEEWVEEHIERDESTESLDELGLPPSSTKTSSSSSSSYHTRPAGSLGCHVDPADLIVLDFGPSPKGRKIERSLSAKRKDNMEAYVPTKPMLVKSKTLDRQPSKESRDSQRPTSRVERPLSAARKAPCEQRDPEDTASMVLQALQRENSPLRSPEPRTVSRSTSRGHQMMNGSLRDDNITNDKDESRVTRAMQRITLMGPRQQHRLLKALEKLEDDSTPRVPPTVDAGTSKPPPVGL